MNCYNMVLDYIMKNEKGTPIFIEEIKDYIIQFYNEKDKEKVFNNVKTILNRMNKEGIIETAFKGIYYIPSENVFGKMLLGNRQILIGLFIYNIYRKTLILDLKSVDAINRLM